MAWLGGQALARYVLDHPEEVEGKDVLDLASGSGVCGLAAARAGARRVLCADVDPLAGAAARRNAELNGLLVETTTDDLLDGPPPDVDVVLAGDVCYAGPMAQRFVAWLQRAGCRVLLGDPGRDYLPRDLEVLATYELETTRELEGVLRKKARVLVL